MRPFIERPVLQLVVDAGATYRLTRLVGTDAILDRPRQAVAEHAEGDGSARDPEHPKLLQFIRCRWCISIWVAAAVVMARRLAPRPWDALATGLTLSAVATLAARLETDRPAPAA